ncbi:histidyl-tRNA synthetase [Halobacillus karajensis]|uniref:Histidine--tRNA ligase n=1 Tax=Halobacillus karajensis TaxID=195088 RepID=A0A024P6P2_9BACI|nr:histidine--tRNA ligase [Halobacillus karajensis]CDQ18102.1 Histidine--tRNA ligase [Halobacillus karajensis]CDQ24453.1 Histidine--tRNA ligase [Halobacillus karajensis]CDQ29299.1 Histidine--tRNA ligase [Halobacillus karajensis]SEH59239.1 histidyl-tRNA synthetase [Halobacillus karajensis]
MSINAPRGTQDILPGTSEKWQYVEQQLADLCRRYNYKEIRTPIFEHTELFQRGVGDSTDIVQKEMYTFEDRGGRSITLRPEGTASVVRSYVQNKVFGLPNQPTKYFYMGPMFRYERPQQGRMRQFVQFGIEALGSDDPAIDAEVLSLALNSYQELGLKSLKLVLNSLGDKESREAHRDALVRHFDPYREELCQDCQVRLDQNPLRVLDCKKDRKHPAMETAPSILEYLNDYSKDYFEKVKQYLDVMGIEYVVDPNLVRGLDYYNHTAFEIMSEAEGFGAITTLSGGGRYTGLVKEVGGPETSGIGFAMSIERLLMALEAENVTLPVDEGLDCYCVVMGEEAERAAVKLTDQLRRAGIQVDKDYLGKKMKAQFKAADRLGSKYVLVLGDQELENGVINVKDMASGEQKEVALDEIIEYMKEKIAGGE